MSTNEHKGYYNMKLRYCIFDVGIGIAGAVDYKNEVFLSNDELSGKLPVYIPNYAIDDGKRYHKLCKRLKLQMEKSND